MPATKTSIGQRVGHFRQILLWPLQLMPLPDGGPFAHHYQLLEQPSADNPWRELVDEFCGDPEQFHERHYSEFVTFLPYVQRFLYGESDRQENSAGYGESPIRIFRRHDVARVRMTYKDSDEPTTFDIVHLDLYFFYDIDVLILVVEIAADDLDLRQCQDTLYRFGRAYPPYWDDDGSGGHCLRRAEWLASDGRVLAVSDYEKRGKYLSFVARFRSPCISSHWEFLLRPLVLHHSDAEGPVRYRQIEYHRMPLLAYLAMDDPRCLSRGDFARLVLVSGPGKSGSLPYSEQHLEGFEGRFCYDRYWHPENEQPGTRLLSCGHAFVMVGSHRDAYFTGSENGLLGQFRHQFFLLALIPHFHKAALLMLSDRLVTALNRLEIGNAESVKRFKRAIRGVLEVFLRFSHRYWFYEISDQAQAKALFTMTREHLGTERLYNELREEIQDMSQYLDSDSLRRQANTVVRLTVVTTAGLIATISTGFLGMNLIDAAQEPLTDRLLFFALVFVLSALLTGFAIVKSKRLSDFLEALSDERLSSHAKLATLVAVWRKKRLPGAD
ncbi:CorA family divalent cation transporter [Accumulibacter sp.]|uniref:CorA family divalent cation transporter n=1 Tax=Accumulibacter sp. TaxID=2053492 RepID=UPI00262D67E6|nr:CorA family divalent cation transporter [Accumulibacter sp.]